MSAGKGGAIQRRLRTEGCSQFVRPSSSGATTGPETLCPNAETAGHLAGPKDAVTVPGGKRPRHSLPQKMQTRSFEGLSALYWAR